MPVSCYIIRHNLNMAADITDLHYNFSCLQLSDHHEKALYDISTSHSLSSDPVSKTCYESLTLITLSGRPLNAIHVTFHAL